jgi:hypothetical protein
VLAVALKRPASVFEHLLIDAGRESASCKAPGKLPDHHAPARQAATAASSLALATAASPTRRVTYHFGHLFISAALLSFVFLLTALPLLVQRVGRSARVSIRSDLSRRQVRFGADKHLLTTLHDGGAIIRDRDWVAGH